VPSITVIGDISIDHFLFLSSEYVDTYCEIKDHESKIVLPYGDKISIPKAEVRCGGNAANLSVGLKRLNIGIDPIIPLGKDIFSQKALACFEKENIKIKGEMISENNRCNSSYVLLYNGERTVFTHHERKAYILEEKFPTDFIYYSSHSGDNTLLSTELLVSLNNSYSRLIFAPGNTQIDGDKEILESLIEKSYLFICNLEEATKIIQKIDEDEIDPKRLLYRLSHFGAHHIVITNGANGVYFYDGDLGETKHLDALAGKDKVVDSTGAGDAMTTGIVYGLVKNQSLESGVKYGLQNSSSVVKYVGAQEGLLSEDELLT
jgi:sugar/nucleoside kinase (ribokinase family)